MPTHTYTGDIEDVAYLEFRFNGGFIANSRVSWLSPNKVRQITIVGSRKMVTFDDTIADAPISIFEKGIEPPRETENFNEWKFAYRYGEIVQPKIEVSEPLRREDEHFISCIETGTQPLTNGINGLNVVSVLHAAQQSVRWNGAPQRIKYAELETEQTAKVSSKEKLLQVPNFRNSVISSAAVI